MANVAQVRVIYHGTVQGVGFRFSVHGIARRLPSVTGYVRNLQDGTVELLAEGDKDELATLLRDIEAQMSSYISRADIVWGNTERSRGHFAIMG